MKHARTVAGPIGSAAIAILLASGASRAQTLESSPWSYDHDMRLTYEVDDNVNEGIVDQDQIRAQVARLAYSGDLRWGSAGEQRLTLSYQGGFKRHFGSSETDVTSQFVNEGMLGYQRRVTEGVALGGTFGVKNRAWTDGFFFINEDGFTRVNGSVSGLLSLEPLSGDESSRMELGARYSDTDFENLDHLFGNHLAGAYASVTKDFGADLTASWSYSFDRVRYPGRGALNPGDDPAAIGGRTRDRQEDHLHEMGTVVTWLGPVSVQGEYSFRLSDSNSYGFSYVSHNLGLQVLRRLPWGMLAQVYAQVELRDFNEPVPNTQAGSLDTGEAENNVLLLRLVKDVTPDYSLEVRYGRYRNEAITLNDFYTKNIYAVGMNYRP